MSDKDSKKEKKKEKKQKRERENGSDQVHQRQWALEEEKQNERNETFVWGAKREVSFFLFHFFFFFFFFFFFSKTFLFRNLSNKE
jgi:hypothetical protein